MLGNLSEKSKNFLQRRFKLKIQNQKLPFGNINKILKTKIKLTDKSLTLITLPTPKQEKLAYYLSEKIQNIKLFVLVHQLQ